MNVARRWGWPIAPFTAAVAMVLTMAPAPSAQAAAPPAATPAAVTPAAPIPHVAKYVPLKGAAGQRPYDTTFNNLDYNGGPVMPANTDYMVLWSPGGLSAYGSSTYIPGVEQYFKDLAHDNGGQQTVESVSAQYQDLTGAFARYHVTFGGSILDTDPYPASQCPAAPPVTNCLTDAQIQTELQHVVTSHHLKADLSHEYFLVTPPHVEGCFTGTAASNPPYGGCSAGQPLPLAVYCAYHTSTTSTPFLIYSVNPYDVGNSGCEDGNHPNGDSDGLINGGLSHEHNESITDPIPNVAWTNGAGANQGMENGDQCNQSKGTPLGTAPNGAKYNQVINGRFYWYQEEWSNKTHSCLQRLATPTSRPVAKLAVTAGSGLTLNFAATGSTAPGGVAQYVWQFNDANGAQTVTTTTPTISHTFPSAGAYSIGLTVEAADGSSAGTGGIASTGHSGFTPGFTDSVSARTVSFSGLTTVSAQPVTVYLWEFGDGTVGSGATPSHTYSKAGTYRVTAVLFSGVGSAYPGSGAAPVVRQTVKVS